MNNFCPVCGYTHAPEDHSICPCCGTEFGYDDATVSHGRLRFIWLKKGAPWFSAYIQPQGGWSVARAYHQLFKSQLLKMNFNPPAPAENSNVFSFNADSLEAYRIAA